MCGIVASASDSNIVGILIGGLKKLEYRGYDSAGIATVHDGKITRIRKQGKVSDLESSINGNDSGVIGIAHTRWATHGKPSEGNAHPHMSNDTIAIVHNGIIENYRSLKEKFFPDNFDLDSQTDSEIIAHLINYFFEQEKTMLQAVQKTIEVVEGSYALAILNKNVDDQILFARKGSPLIIGVGQNANYVASDVQALIEHTNQMIYLEDGDFGFISSDNYEIYDTSNKKVKRPIVESKQTLSANEKGDFEHYMQKEIYEQPSAIKAALQDRIIDNKVPSEILGPNINTLLSEITCVQIIACGTSYHAALVMKHWLDRLAGIPSHAEVASEFRYRKHAVQKGTLVIAISQSGETADTLAALRETKKDENYIRSIAICNVPESSLARESDITLMTHAGPEIGVASTKAFTSQLVVLMLTAIALGRNFNITEDLEKSLCEQLLSLPEKIESTLKLDKEISKLAKNFSDKKHALFLGRGSHFPIAREGALKLKEISYIHAEAYPAGELKHGPLAIVDDAMPVVAVAPNNITLEKLKSNLEEVKARGGKLYIFADKRAHFTDDAISKVFEIDAPDNPVAPILFTIPLQLLAYHCALIKGTDVDQPRNLAKSVTVE